MLARQVTLSHDGWSGETLSHVFDSEGDMSDPKGALHAPYRLRPSMADVFSHQFAASDFLRTRLAGWEKMPAAVGAKSL